MKLSEVFNENKEGCIYTENNTIVFDVDGNLKYIYDKSTCDIFSVKEKSANGVYKLKGLKNDEVVYITKEDAEVNRYEYSIANLLNLYNDTDDNYFKLVNGADKFAFIKDAIIHTDKTIEYDHIISSQTNDPFTLFDEFLHTIFNIEKKEKAEICIPLSVTDNKEIVLINFTITKEYEPNNDSKFWHYHVSTDNNSVDNIDIFITNFKLVIAFLNYVSKSKGFYTGLLKTLYTNHIDTMNISRFKDISDYIRYNNYDYGIVLFGNLGFLKFNKMVENSDLPSFLKKDKGTKSISLTRIILPVLNEDKDIIFPEEIYNENVPLFVADVDDFNEYIEKFSFENNRNIDYDI